MVETSQKPYSTPAAATVLQQTVWGTLVIPVGLQILRQGT